MASPMIIRKIHKPQNKIANQFRIVNLVFDKFTPLALFAAIAIRFIYIIGTSLKKAKNLYGLGAYADMGMKNTIARMILENFVTS